MTATDMDAYVRWTDSNGQDQTHKLAGDEVVIGRKSDAAIVIPNPYVSRYHAKLVRQGLSWVAVDLSNNAGTFVNGRRITEQLLQHGDRITLGSDQTEFRYFVADEYPRRSRNSFTSGDGQTEWTELPALAKDFAQFSDLEKMSSLLELQYEWGRKFSPDTAFDQILGAALRISKAERGYILLKREDRFEYISGLGENGQRLRESEFMASQSVARQVARDGTPVYTAEDIEGDIAQQQSVVALRLRSLACMPLQWLSPAAEAPTINGVLYLDSTHPMRALSILDQKILNKLAVEAAQVFEKLELIRTLEQRKALASELAVVQRELQAAEAVRQAEAKVLLAEYGTLMGRFAAALSHELNSPLGALKAALQTSAALAVKRPSLRPEKLAEMEGMESKLRDTALESLERLHQVVLRMQRFTNLDRSETLPVDLNSLLRDVIDILRVEMPSEVFVDLAVRPLDAILVRPQQISAVFSNLLQNAVDGLHGRGQIRVTTCQTASHVEVTIEDNGGGLSAEELASIFDPSFKVSGGRVTGNWSLFSSRQIVREHGGEIDVQSSGGKGTQVRVTLPVSALT